MTSIELSGLRKEFSDVVAVDDIDLSVNDGEFLVIVGPSGCGKSTTLRTIAGLETVTDGTIHFGDRAVQSVDPEDRDVAMVFQNYALYPHMTARQNMSFGAASATGLGSEEIDKQVEAAAETLEIQALLNRQPDELSGGEQQRVAIGRALVRDPDVLLMDEPLSNLDAKLRTEMRTELQALHAELATTTVYVTHDQTEAMTLADRVAVMRDGAVQQVDDPQHIYDYPANRFVAGFIGSPSMNILHTRIESRGGRTAATGVDYDVQLPDTPGTVTEAALGIRPEDIHLLTNVDHTSEPEIQLSAYVTESLGDTLLVHGHVGDDSMTVAVDPHREITTGDTLELACDPDRIHLFDPDSGEAIYHSSGVQSAEAPPIRR
ncbi:MAG: ABC transporter ATP-binding protein [Halobacteriales archaeon]|nr:ABC transporter ATP-binding protein [Halobacteriales archaeon]